MMVRSQIPQSASVSSLSSARLDEVMMWRGNKLRSLDLRSARANESARFKRDGHMDEHP